MTRMNTSDLFEACLSRFAEALMQARHRAGASDISVHEAIAVEGFVTCQRAASWTAAHSLFIRERVAGELSPEALEWFEEGAEAVSLFSCFVLGTLLGQRESGAVDSAGFMLGEAHLPAFIMLHNERIII